MLPRLTLLLALLAAAPAVVCAQAATEPPKIVVEPLPEAAPAWLAGYQVRYTLRVSGDIAQSKSKSITARLPTGGWLRANQRDVAVVAADGTALPVAVLSHAPTGDTLIQFPRHNNDVWYYVFAAHPSAEGPAMEPIPEGVLFEARDWPAGGDISSWNVVREGMSKIETLSGSALVGEVFQNANPARPATPKNYAVTYRGQLNIKADGAYRFFVNSEDASYLFIDGFKVCDRSGPNARMRGTIPTQSIGTLVELKAGEHPLEVHHVLTENPDTYGGCTLLWVPPGEKTWAIVPRDAFVHPDFAMVAAIEAPGPTPAAVFDYGIDDTLVTTGGGQLLLVRFEAQGDLPVEASLQWDFGDGTTAVGRSVRHVYFGTGDYEVTLKGAGALPPFKRRIHVWPAPGEISPFSIPLVLQTLEKSDWKSFPPERQDLVLSFLFTCEHPARWPFLGALTSARLKAADLDLQYRAQLYRGWIEATAHTGRPADLPPLVKQARAEFAKLPTMLVGIDLSEADAYLRQFKDAEQALTRYEALLDKHRRLEHPDVRIAAIHWGDLVAEQGDLKQAAELYKTAAALGGADFQATAQTSAITRGALLRVAEQKLRTGNIHETRQLLDKIELQYPEQKLEGLYRFLRAESDRVAGRYEEALRNYEVLLQLRQWAGYRDRTMHGIADCYARMDDVEQALKWFAQLEKAFPTYFKTQKLSDQQASLFARRARTGEKGTGPLKFQEFATGFEPGEAESIGESTTIKIVRGLGFNGPHVLLLDSYPIYRGYLTWNRPLPTLTPGGQYWGEFWYREDMFDRVPGFNPHYYFYLYGQGTDIHPTKGQLTFFPERTVGSWRKVGFLFQAPLANEGKLTISSLAVAVQQLDALSIRAVTDRDLDILGSFIEGSSTEESE